jgi:tetratricopeptide (TPR) repeat protein
MVQAKLAAHRIGEAANICTLGLKEQPHNAKLWQDLSQISMRTGNINMMINSALKSIDCEPKNVWYVFHLAGCYLHLNLFDPAIKALNATHKLLTDVTPAEQWDKLGELYYMANKLDDAIAAHTKALHVKPNSKQSRNQLAALYRFKGDNQTAEQLCREVIELAPNNYQACYNLSQLRRFKADDNVLKLINTCFQTLPADHKGRIMLHYACGKVYEDIQDYKQAFEHYEKGAALKSLQRKYIVDKDLALMDTLVEYSDKHDVVNTEPLNQTPIFIVGLPRTGTTLVERIISSHPKVTTGGELNAFPMALLGAGGKPTSAGLDGLDDELIKNIDAKAISVMAQRYLQLANNYVDGAPLFIDKLPYNFLYCGLILKAFPNAKIIHVKRDPLDAAVSNLKMLFDRGYEYSYNQENTADFIAGYKKLMEQWQTRFSDKIYTIEYERLVANQEEETRSLLKFCQLDWADECLHFHTNRSASQTASASQIREPIHSRSVNLWRQYEKQLTPLLERFQHHGITPKNNTEQ